jgi:putative MATE family efflux protein
MWIDVWALEIQSRERIADAQQRAARSHLIHAARPPGTRPVRALVSRLVGAASSLARRAAATPAGGAARTQLLLEGPIVRTLLRLGAPNVVVNVVVIAVTATVDAYFVGRLGSSALAGLALVFPAVMLMQQMANGSMGAAIASAVARAMGAGRRDDASALVIHGLVIGLGMAALFSALVLTGGPTLFRLMGGRGPALDAAVEYSQAVFAGAFAYWTLGALTNAVRGAGQAAILAGVYLAAEALHVLLVPALVFGIGPLPPLGIRGAGIATVTAFTASAAVLAWYVASGRTAIALSLGGFRPSRRLFLEILRVGAPSSLTTIFSNLSLAVLTGFVGTLGPAAVAGFGAAVRLEYVQIPLTFGLGVGVLAMVGTGVGAGRWGRAIRVTWTAAALAMAATGAIGLVVTGWPDTWMALFTADPAVRAAGARYLRLVGLAYPFLGLGFTLAYAFQAAGRPLWPFVAIAGRALVVVAGGWVALRWPAGGLVGPAIVVAVGLVAYGSTLAIAFRGIGTSESRARTWPSAALTRRDRVVAHAPEPAPAASGR